MVVIEDENGGLAKPDKAKSPHTTKSLTEVRRYKDMDGTYEVTLVEQSRRKLTLKDELLPVIARLASNAHEAWKHEQHLTSIGRKDAFMIFAQEFLNYLEDDPYKFDDFLDDIKSWPRQAKADDPVIDLGATNHEPAQTSSNPPRTPCNCGKGCNPMHPPCEDNSPTSINEILEGNNK